MPFCPLWNILWNVLFLNIWCVINLYDTFVYFVLHFIIHWSSLNTVTKKEFRSYTNFLILLVYVCVRHYTLYSWQEGKKCLYLIIYLWVVGATENGVCVNIIVARDDWASHVFVLTAVDRNRKRNWNARYNPVNNVLCSFGIDL